MKKFMKAIAFVTVMCLALSTVAFAHQVPETAPEKIFNVTVTGAGDEQVALIVVAEGATNFDAPLYIDQKASDNGSVSFSAVLTNADATVNAVDVYVGYASNQLDGDGKAPKIGTVALTQPITTVNVEVVNAGIIQGLESLKAQEQTGAGVWAEIAVEAPEGVAATEMFWAIRYDYVDENGETKSAVKYSDKLDISGYSIGNMVSGSVKLGLAFLNGSDLNNIKPVEITDVDAIFMFKGTVNGKAFEQEFLTNSADAHDTNQ